MADVINFPARRATDKAPAPPPAPGRRASRNVALSLPLLLRGAPPELAPLTVAEAMVSAASSTWESEWRRDPLGDREARNAAARDAFARAWIEAKATWRAHLDGLRLPVSVALRLEEEWRAAIRQAGVAAKARARAAKAREDARIAALVEALKEWG